MKSVAYEYPDYRHADIDTGVKRCSFFSLGYTKQFLFLCTII